MLLWLLRRKSIEKLQSGKAAKWQSLPITAFSPDRADILKAQRRDKGESRKSFKKKSQYCYWDLLFIN
jgi:hypothetical protein